MKISTISIPMSTFTIVNFNEWRALPLPRSKKMAKRRKLVEFDVRKVPQLGLTLKFWARSDEEAVEIANNFLRPKPPEVPPPKKGVNKKTDRHQPKPPTTTLEINELENWVDNTPDELGAYNTAYLYLGDYPPLTVADITICYDDSDEYHDEDPEEDEEEEEEEEDEEANSLDL
jgi:hypothetical protein